jgi:methylphosphotriester-DNA--protein-cysteine methyltransferase
MAAATDREVPLARLCGVAHARDLLAALEGARSRAGRCAAAERWLLERLAEAPRRGTGARIAVDLILKTRGSASIASIAAALEWSRRRLQRAFCRDLGVQPKLYARIVRLNAVLASLDRAERASAVDLALDAGYFDQAHLLRDFRLLAGRRPGAAREADGELARHFTHPERLRALLRGD